MSQDGGWHVVALAVVSRAHKPLMEQFFLRHISAEDELALEFLLHSSLDVCDDKTYQHARIVREARSKDVSGSPGRGISPGAGYDALSEQFDCFLGGLLQAQRYWTWGYQSSTGVRVIIATWGEPEKGDIKALLSGIYRAVSVSLCNPFRDHNAPLDDAEVKRRISNLIGKHVSTFTLEQHAMQM